MTKPTEVFLNIDPTADALGAAIARAAKDGVIQGKALVELFEFIVADMEAKFHGKRIDEALLANAKGYIYHANDMARRHGVSIILVGSHYRLGVTAFIEVELVGRNLSLGLRRAR